VNQLDDWQARYNLRPGQLNPVITRHSPNRISRMFWGLIPHWAKDQTRRFSTINAKAETAAELPTYRDGSVRTDATMVRLVCGTPQRGVTLSPSGSSVG
jgi:putative SOS response-associated peptidase YedK